MFTKNEQKKLFWQIFNANNEDELHNIICNNPIFLDENNWFPYGGTLCVYNSETTPPNNLECKAEEKMRCPRIQMVE
jgi:hypothetical protein